MVILSTVQASIATTRMDIRLVVRPQDVGEEQEER
jgi:hypothetical protein